MGWYSSNFGEVNDYLDDIYTDWIDLKFEGGMMCGAGLGQFMTKFQWDETNFGVFCYKSGKNLLHQFKWALEVMYWYIAPVATDMDTDVVVMFLNREQSPLGYFYRGEYYLWEKE